MKMHLFCGALLVFAIAPAASGNEADVAENRSDEHPAHEELRALRDAMFQAYKQRDLDQLLQTVHPQVVVTWQNGDRNRSREDVRRFYDEMMTGDDSVVESVTSKLTMDGLSILHGEDAAVAFGTLNDDFKLRDGTELQLESRFTATACT